MLKIMLSLIFLILTIYTVFLIKKYKGLDSKENYLEKKDTLGFIIKLIIINVFIIIFMIF